MGRWDDAFEIVRANNPVDETTVADATSAKARALLTEIVATPRPQLQRPKRTTRRRLAFAIAIALLAVASIAAAWLVLREVTDPISVGCYQDTNLNSDVVAVVSSGALDVSLCIPAWEDGTLTNNAVAPPGQVPPLLGCVTDTGKLAVFPSNDENLCHALGLAEPDPESVPAGDAVRRLNEALVTHFAANACLTIEDARIDVRDTLDTNGSNDWRIEISPGGPGRPCASFGLDAPNHTVRLIPIPPPE
ncbi:MAG: hypothetical protein WBP49_11680 [Acidimicrobiia bacterium]